MPADLGAQPVQKAAGADLTTQRFHDLAELRINVFVVEQVCAYAELDGRDLSPATVHYWIDDSSQKPVASLRVLGDEDPQRIGRVVTRADARRNNLAQRLMEAVLADLQGPIGLSAQTYLVEWYSRFGFHRSGDPFVEDGIPHQAMLRSS